MGQPLIDLKNYFSERRLPLLRALAGLFCLACVAWRLKVNDVGAVRFNLEVTAAGSYLLAGLRNWNVTYNMPFWDLASALSLNLGLSQPVTFTAVYAGVCLLVFCAGCLLRGYRAGLLAVLAALVFEAGSASYDAEQTFYAFFLLLSLVTLLLKFRDDSVKTSLVAGLAIGFSLLIRTPLFLLPPLVVLIDRLRSTGTSRAFLLRSLVFLAASYALLLPWSAARYPLTGKFSLLDDRRAAPNLITSARGSVYNMEGDYLRLAGIKDYDASYGFFLREVAKNPVFYLSTVLKRLWAIFLFDPLLYLALIAALLAARDPERRQVLLLPVYFILFHSLFSVEKRYLYPLAYLAAPAVAAALFPAGAGRPRGRAWCAGAVSALFMLSLALVAVVELVIASYPFRSAAGGDLAAALVRFPRDRVVQKLGCETLRDKGDYPAFYGCLSVYAPEFDDKLMAYFLETRVSGRPAVLPRPQDPPMEPLIILMLRELELGDRDAAAASFSLAYEQYLARHNMLNGVPYERDAQITAFLRQDSATFWNRYVYDALLLWPTGGAAKILSTLGRKEKLTPKLRLLEFAASRACRSGGLPACLSRRDELFAALARELLRPRQARARLLAGEAGDPRPAAAAYFRSLSAPSPAPALFGAGVSEAELFAMLDLLYGSPAAAQAATGPGERPFYLAASALYAENATAAALEKNLDALELRCAQQPSLLRALAGLEAAAGRGAAARRLEALAENFRPPLAQAGGKDGARSRALSDSAVEKIKAGDLAAAEKLLLSALRLDGHNPEALMNLCSVRSRNGEQEKALEACLAAAQAVHDDPAYAAPGMEILASEALFQSYSLLIGLGRQREAADMLRRCVERAPAAWPGLAAAKKELLSAAAKP